MKRKIINEDRCEHCKDQKEDVIHALYQCPKLQDLYSSLKQATPFIDLMECVFADKRDPELFSMVAWAIWNRRNNLCLGKATTSLDELLSQTRDRLREFKLYNSSSVIPVGRPPTRWQAPDQNTYKVNFDDALFSTANTAGMGVVIRNEDGQVVVSLSQKTTLPFTAIKVEAMAANRALELALETGFQQIILEGGSQILLLALENNSHTLSNFGHLITNIHYLASCFSKIQYSHVRRHCNTIASSEKGSFFILNASLDGRCTTRYQSCTSGRFRWPPLI